MLSYVFLLIDFLANCSFFYFVGNNKRFSIIFESYLSIFE
nr:MAG TPA: hypothetical protein [Caudoviricetes sp.]